MTPVRAAVPADAEAIDLIEVHAWERAYGDFIPPDRMKSAQPVQERVARWRERLQDGELRTWVYAVEGSLVAFASAGGGELKALYVDPAAQGAGVGTALLDHVEAAMRSEGAEEATLWVFRANEHGRRFYEARGWSLVPGNEDDVDRSGPGVRYRKRL